MNKQKSRRINRKQIKRKTIKRKTIKRKTIKRKTIKRKTIKRKTIKRKTIKRKQNKKIAYNQKKMHGGKFNPVEEKALKKSLEKFNFNDEELNEVITKLGSGSHHFWGKYFEQLKDQIGEINDKEDFLEWLTFYCSDFGEEDGTDSEYEDEDEDEDEDEEEWLATNHDEDED